MSNMHLFSLATSERRPIAFTSLRKSLRSESHVYNLEHEILLKEILGQGMFSLAKSR